VLERQLESGWVSLREYSIGGDKRSSSRNRNGIYRELFAKGIGTKMAARVSDFGLLRTSLFSAASSAKITGGLHLRKVTIIISTNIGALSNCAQSEKLSEMETGELLSLVEHLEDNIDDLEESLEPLLAVALSATTKKLPVLDKAKLYVLIVYSIESLLFCKFHTFG
jgi:hypothetical protein